MMTSSPLGCQAPISPSAIYNPSPFDAALWYAQLGYTLTPLGRKAKKPSLTNWPNRPITTREQVERADRAEPGRNFGVMTGAKRGLVIVDTDSENAEAWASEHLPPTPYIVRTRKGFHRYYRVPAGVDSVPRRVRPQVDGGKISLDILGDGSQGVAAGALHPEGGTYTPLSWPPPPLASLPTLDIAQYFPDTVKPLATKESAPPIPNLHNIGHDTKAKRAKGLIDLILREDGAPSKGERNDRAYTIAAKLARDFDLPDLEAWELLAYWNSHCTPPLGEGELRAILESAKKHGREAPGHAFRNDIARELAWASERDQRRLERELEPKPDDEETEEEPIRIRGERGDLHNRHGFETRRKLHAEHANKFGAPTKIQGLISRIVHMTRCGNIRMERTCRFHPDEGSSGFNLPCDDKLFCPHCAHKSAKVISKHIGETWPEHVHHVFVGKRLDDGHEDEKIIPGDRAIVRKVRQGLMSIFDHCKAVKPRWVETWDGVHLFFLIVSGIETYARCARQGDGKRITRKEASTIVFDAWTLPARMLQPVFAAHGVGEIEKLNEHPWIGNRGWKRTDGGRITCKTLDWKTLDEARIERKIAKEIETGVPSYKCACKVAMPDGSIRPCATRLHTTYTHIPTGHLIGRDNFGDQDGEALRKGLEKPPFLSAETRHYNSARE